MPNDFKAILDKLPFWTLIDITGGEPFSHSNVDEILKLLLRSGRKVSITTNGTLVSLDRARYLVKENLSYYMFSIDGGPSFHDSIRGSGTFERTMNSARTITKEREVARKRFPLMNPKITLLPSCPDSPSEIVTAIENYIRCDSITFNMPFSNPARGGNPLQEALDAPPFTVGNTFNFSPTEQLLMRTKLVQIEQLKVKRPDLRIAIRPEISKTDALGYFENPQKYGPKKCLRNWGIITMDGCGQLTPCDLALNLGNIRDYKYDLSSIRETTTFKTFSRDFNSQDNPACRGCCLAKHQSSN